MAKISIEFDTVEKTLKVSANDKEIENISSVEFFKYGEDGSMEIRTVDISEDDKIVTVTRLLANENGNYNKEVKTYPKEFDEIDMSEADLTELIAKTVSKRYARRRDK